LFLAHSPNEKMEGDEKKFALLELKGLPYVAKQVNKRKKV